MVKYGVVNTSFNSSKTTWEDYKTWEYAYMMTEGLGAGTFIADELFDTKEEAKSHSYEVREWDRYELEHRRSGYSSYKHRIWVHEFISRGGNGGAYLPTVGEIRKGLEYIKENLKSEKFDPDWVDWMVAHEGMTPAEIRQELIDNYMKD